MLIYRFSNRIMSWNCLWSSYKRYCPYFLGFAKTNFVDVWLVVFSKSSLESCVVILSSSFVKKQIYWSLDLRIFKMSLTLLFKVCILLNNKFYVFVRLSRISYKSSKDFIESLLVELLLLLIISRCLSRTNQWYISHNFFLSQILSFLFSSLFYIFTLFFL